MLRRCRSERKNSSVSAIPPIPICCGLSSFLFLVGLLLAGFLIFGRSSGSGSVLPAWVQGEHVEPPDERLAAAQKEKSGHRGVDYDSRHEHRRACAAVRRQRLLSAP